MVLYGIRVNAVGLWPGIAGAASFLASHASAMITGQALSIGGYVHLVVIAWAAYYGSRSRRRGREHFAGKSRLVDHHGTELVAT
jgi:hypothetical protein